MSSTGAVGSNESRLKKPSAITRPSTISFTPKPGTEDKENAPSSAQNIPASHRRTRSTDKKSQPMSRSTSRSRAAVSTRSRTATTSTRSRTATTSASASQRKARLQRRTRLTVRSTRSRQGSGNLSSTMRRNAGSKRTNKIEPTNQSPKKKQKKVIAQPIPVAQPEDDGVAKSLMERIVEDHIGPQYVEECRTVIATKVKVQRFNLAKSTKQLQTLIKVLKKQIRGFSDKRTKILASIREAEARREGQETNRAEKIESLLKSEKDLKLRFDSVKQELEKAKAALEVKKEEIHAANAKFRDEQKSLEIQLATAFEQKKRVDDEKAELSNQMKVLAAEKETFTVKLNEVKTELDSCRSQIKDLETKIAVAESTSVAEKARLSQSIAELKARRDADLVDLKSANSKDMSELRAELAEVRDAESKLKIELQTKREACAKFETDFRAAEMRLREQELKTREAEMNLKVAETQRNHLRSQLEENKEQINRAYKSFEQTSKMHDEALKEKEEWKQKVEELTKDRDAQQKVAHETDMKYNAQINELDKKLQALEHDLADVTEKKNAFEAQLQQQLEETKAAKASEAKVQELYESSRKNCEKAYLEVNSLRKLQVENLGNKGSHEQMERIMDLSIKLETTRAQLADKATMAAELAKCREVIKTLRSEAFHAEMVRRGLHNQIQDLKGNIRVMVRVRPFLPHDGTDHATPLRYAADKQGLKLVSGDERKSVNAFKFDHVFGGHTGQELVFKEVSGLVQSALDGYNVCLFSYGQTGSGKTHTMQGSPAGEMRGMIPRSIEKVLETSKKLRSQGWEFGLRVSFLEIYNETIRDLLGKKDAVGLPIKQTRDGKNVEVIGLTKVEFKTMAQVTQLIQKANHNRSVASTAMNAQSSRSHSVFTMYLTGINRGEGLEATGELHLVDLAGSERLARSQATGARLKETQAINKSLSCLADVFFNISQKSSHIPFRNSKLTYLLQNCFGKDGKTMMFVNLSPTAASAHETLCSLRFASKVNQCTLGKPSKQVKKISDSSSGSGKNPGGGRGTGSSSRHMKKPRIAWEAKPPASAPVSPNKPVRARAGASKRAASRGRGRQTSHKRVKSTTT